MSKRYLYNINGKLEDNSLEKFTTLPLECRKIIDMKCTTQYCFGKKRLCEAIKINENDETNLPLECRKKENAMRCTNQECWKENSKLCTVKKKKINELKESIQLQIDKINASDKDRFWKLSKISDIRKYVNNIKNEYIVEWKYFYMKWGSRWLKKNIVLDITELKNNYDIILAELQLLYSKPVDCKYKYDKCDLNCNSKLIIEIKPDDDGKKCPENLIKCPEGKDDCPYKPVDCIESYSDCKLIDGECKKKKIIYQQSLHNGKNCVLPEYIKCQDGEGLCPVNCIGQFSNCNNECEMEYQIVRPAINGGKSCIHKNGYKTACEPGQGNCPSEANFINLYFILGGSLLILAILFLKR